ncbi:MAG: 4-(cytidine 5'-diphospho)-2-C-methyl-D-erythritol kinase [Lachnospiraceae bacterium]|nr:4-(cytidine 5'-diphospho)-2-C-methyl-D-erythritol kinase [Lachnospiraceae bacterium]
MEELKLRSLAKINLGLDVLGQKEDGYHLVKMLMQTVYLYDNVYIKKTKAAGVRLSSTLYYLPVDERNIAYKAARMLLEEFQIATGVQIHLEKHIPVAAGLAGGSSNAATVLFGVNRLFRLGLSLTELMERGLKIGADVPYCLMRGTVLAEGIGEVLTPLPDIPKCIILLAKPNISVSTKKVYAALDGGAIVKHPDIDGMIGDIKSGSLAGIAGKMGNVLEQVTIPMHPKIALLKKMMLSAGALGAMMSGSGPTVFGIFDSKEKAFLAKKQIGQKRLAQQIFITNNHAVRR